MKDCIHLRSCTCFGKGNLQAVKALHFSDNGKNEPEGETHHAHGGGSSDAVTHPFAKTPTHAARTSI